MVYVSIDLETSGLNPKKDEILSIGMVVEDTENILPIEELPRLHIYIVREELKGNIFALDMNRDIIRALNEYNIFGMEKDGVLYLEDPFDIVCAIKDFLATNGITDKIIVAGKNPSFDMSFLKKAFGKKLQFSQRVLDPAILYMNLLKDKEVPNLKECLKRAGIEKEVAHDALEDALDVIRLLRKKY